MHFVFCSSAIARYYIYDHRILIGLLFIILLAQTVPYFLFGYYDDYRDNL